MTEQDKIWIIVTVINPIVNALERQTTVLEALGDTIGRSTAKWLELANLPGVQGELREDALLELGFQPVEVVDFLYPNLGKDARKTKRTAICKRRSKSQKK